MNFHHLNHNIHGTALVQEINFCSSYSNALQSTINDSLQFAANIFLLNEINMQFLGTNQIQMLYIWFRR